MIDLSGRKTPAVAALPPASTALAGAIFRLTTDNNAYWCTGSAWIKISPRLIAFAGESKLGTVGAYLSFGTTITTGGLRGITMVFPGNVIALSIGAKVAGTGQLTLELTKNDVATGAMISLAASVLVGHVLLSPVVSFVADDVLNIIINTNAGHNKFTVTIYCEV